MASVSGVSIQKFARARVRSRLRRPGAGHPRHRQGLPPLDGYEIARGRAFSDDDIANAAPVAILGSEALGVFFPNGDAIGKTIRVGDVPVQVVGVLKERVFRFRQSNRNMFRWRNRIVAVPSSLVARRFLGDRYHRLDRMTFRIRNFNVMEAFSKKLGTLLTSNHRLQNDYRIDNVAARVRKERSQGDVYDIIFLLSGVLSLVGGGMVNVNIQLASLKERIREVGVKMAIGASGPEVFKDFMTEAMLLTAQRRVRRPWAGRRILGGYHALPRHSAPLDAKSFLWAWAIAGIFGLVFALYPAWKASRLSPMEALAL